MNIEQSTLPKSGSLFTIDEFSLNNTRKSKMQLFDFIENKFNKKLRTFASDADESDNQQYFEMRCFIDTREQDNFGKKGYRSLKYFIFQAAFPIQKLPENLLFSHFYYSIHLLKGNLCGVILAFLRFVWA